ncbi:MAG: hypothetical protein AAF152_04180 [Cyanobacteria bacterium P01_A01_bin.114]
MTSGIDRLGILKVNGSDTTVPINIRQEPNGKVKATRPQSTQVNVLAAKPPDAQGYKWYKISYGSGPNDAGWVRQDVISLQQPAAPPAPDLTQLYFETPSRVVRVFIDNNLLLMNLYNKSTKITELSQLTTLRLPVGISNSEETASAWRSYVAHKDGLVYIVRYVPLAQTELIRSGAIDGIVIDRENGFSSKGSAYTRT